MMLDWIKDLLFGRPLTPQDILADRVSLCRTAGVVPESVANFWVGIEQLKPVSDRDLADLRHPADKAAAAAPSPAARPGARAGS